MIGASLLHVRLQEFADVRLCTCACACIWQAGQHTVHIKLHGAEIEGSPLRCTVHAAPLLPNDAKSVAKCFLSRPSTWPTATPVNQNCQVLLTTVDRYGNLLKHGGHRIDAKAHGAAAGQCTVEDRADGTYIISLTCGAPGEVHVLGRCPSLAIIMLACPLGCTAHSTILPSYLPTILPSSHLDPCNHPFSCKCIYMFAVGCRRVLALSKLS